MEQLERAFARYRDGRDPAALGEVFDLAAPEVLRIATYLVRDADFAEDLVQQTFLGAIEGADRFEPGRPLMPWLLGILANQVRGQRRRRARKPDPARLRRRGEPDPAEAADRRELDETVRAAIARIDEPYRAVLSLSLADGLSPKEIAASLDRPQGTVRSQLHRGLDLLRKALPLGFAAGALGGTRGLAAIRTDVLAAAGTGPATSMIAGLGIAQKAALVGVAAVLVLVVAWGAREATRSEGPGGFRSDRSASKAARDRGATEARAPSSSTADPAGRETSDSAPSVGSEKPFSVRVALRGEPAAGVAAIATSLDGTDPEIYSRRGLTDAEGRWRFGAPGAQLVLVTLVAGPRAVLEPGEFRDVSYDLEDGLRVVGRVLDMHGAPVGDARLEAALPPEFTSLLVARTGSDGRFRIPLIASGAKLTARAPGFTAAAAYLVSGQPGDEVSCDLRLASPGASIAIRVVDENNTPVPGAVVLSGTARPDDGLGARAVTGADGGATLLGFPDGAAEVVVRARGFQPRRGEFAVTAGSVTRRTIELRRSAVIRGVVRDAQGEPASRLRVAVAGPRDPFRAQTFTDLDGRYVLDELPAEVPFRVVAGRSGGPQVERIFRLRSGEEEEWNARLPGRAKLSGTLVDADGNALSGWLVHVSGVRWSQTAVTLDGGAFSLEVPDPEADYTLRPAPMSDPKSYRAKKTWKPADGAIRLVVPAGEPEFGTIEGRIEDPQGKPLGGIHVFAIAVAGSAIRGAATAHKDGRFEIRNVVPGGYRIATRDEQGRHPLLRLGEHEIAARVTTDVGTHRMPVGGRILSRVVVPDGVTRYSAGVIGWWSGMATGGKRLADGSRLSGLLAPGTYVVLGTGYLDGKSIQKEVEVEVRPGETTEVTVDLTADD